MREVQFPELPALHTTLEIATAHSLARACLGPSSPSGSSGGDLAVVRERSSYLVRLLVHTAEETKILPALDKVFSPLVITHLARVDHAE